ncbi:MAG: DNRLRE domain-containing protein, partial [bacterium]
MGHIDVELPPGYRGYMRDQVFFPKGRPPNNSIGLTPDVGYIVEDLGFDHLPGTGDAGEGNLFLDCEDLNGNGILDPGEDAGLDRKLGTFDAGEGNGLMDCEDIGLDGVAMSGDEGEFNGFIDPKPADLIVCGDALSDTTLLGFAVECDTVTHNGMSRNLQWLTANYRADLYIEKIPATVGHINGFVWNDHLARGTWLGDGVYDPEEERTMHGVRIELWDATMTTLIADTVTGKFDKAATKAQGWVEPYTFPPDELGGVFVGPQVGYFEFRDVPTGTYKVKVIPPAGFSPSDLLHPAGIATVTVGAGARNDVNFGVNSLVPLAGEIEGGVFDDLNIDGRGGPFTPDPSDVTSLLFAEKAGIPHVPVGVYDHLGYNLGVGFMGNPLCFAGAPDSLECTAWDALGNCTAADTMVGTPQCPPGEDPVQKPEMERRFAPGVHIYAGNDAAFDGVCPNYLPLILPYTFGQGKFKFEADWSLVPTAIPLDPGCNIDPLISMTEPIIIDPFAPPPPAPMPGRRFGRRAPKVASSVSVASVTLSPGDVYRVQGLGFGDAQGFQTVTLSGQKLTVQAWTDTYIDVEIPTDAISGPIVVTATTGHSNALKVDINYSASRANYLQKRSVYVDASNAGAEDGSEAHPYNTIQEALDNLPGKSPRYVFIAAGTYNELVHIKDDDVHLIGCGPHETVINGLPAQLDVFHQGASSGAGPVIFIGKGGKTGALENISISGLTVTGGTVNANDLGCGIFGDYGNQNIDINTCRIYQNGGYYGGGIWLHYSNHNVQIWSNIIAENGNFGGYGGGISVNDEPEYDDFHHGQPEHIGDDYTPGPPPGTYEIYNNIIFHNWSADLGGGICLYEIKDHLKVYGNVMLENKSEDHGGALFFEDCGPVDVWGNAFIRNYSPDDGGAISFEDVADTLAHINIWNNLFAENIADDHGENTARGGALAFDDIRDANVFNNTFVGNIVAGSAGPAGGAIDSERHGHEYNGTDGVYMAPGYSHPKIYNNIIWDNWRLEYDQKGAASDEEDLDASWGKNYRWTLDQLHVDNPHLQPEWEKQNNSNSFGYVRYNIISGGYDYTNLLPTADAGPDQLVIDEDRDHFEDVWLDGSGSFDPDGPITSYDWFDNDSPIATGVNPLVNLSVGTHYIDLVIWDDRGGTATDQVVIDVGRPKDDKKRPVANAGPDQTVIDIEDDGVEDVTLDGSGSTTPEGAIVSYVWTEDGSQIATGATAVVSLSVGTHVIKLTVTDDRDLRAGDEVVVDVRPGGASFAAIHDSYVKSSSPNKNFGSKTNVRIRGGNPAYTAYLKFDVSGLTAPVKKAILLLYVRQASPEGGTIYAVSNDYIGTTTPWEEDGLTAGNAPLISDPPLSSVGAAEMDTWVRFDVTSAITGDGTYSFGIANADFSDVKYSSKEGSYPPELVIVTESGAGVNQSPIAHAGADQALTDTDNNSTEDVQLDGSASFDLDGSLSAYVWSEGGSQIATGANPLVSLGVGTHFIDLTVTDNLGATGTDQVMVTVNTSGGGPSVAVSFTPSDDAQVKSSSENKNFASKS